jgi:hypothetical protein
MMANDMRWAVSLLCCLGSCLNGSAAAELTEGRTVYLMAMGRGLDQFLANRLTRMHVLQVVTDPAKADMVLTDQVGATLEDKLKDLYPPPPDPEAIKAAKEKEAAKEAVREAAAKERTQTPGSLPSRPSLMDDTVNKADKPGSMGVSGRTRGTIFLVDVRSRQVLWSAFEKPKNFSPQELDRTAQRVVKLLKVDLSPKAK